MKRLFMLLLVTLMTIGVAEAKKESNTKEVVTTTFTTDIDCESCERKIINSIPFKKGVSEVKVDIPTKQVKVSYNSSKCSDEQLIAEFKKIGVEAKVASPTEQPCSEASCCK